MINELRALAIFSKTVETGSFRSAAKELNLAPSVVSHHISQLELKLGVTLLYRSTRQISLTQEGEKLFVAAKAMMHAAETGLNTITHQSPEPTGKLHITLPAFFSRSDLLKDISAFAKTYPKVSLEINFSDVMQNLIRDGIDLAIRMGALKDSALKAKKLFDMKRELVIAPSYMANRKTPHKPQDLMDWDWIGLKMRPNHKMLINKAGKTVKIPFNPSIMVDSVDAVCQLALTGLGLATPPSFLVKEAIQKGHLIDPLPAWNIAPLSVYAVWPSNATRTSLTFRLIDFLESKLKT